MTKPMPDAERVSDIVASLRALTVRELPKDWKEGRKCPECDVGANRQKCMWDMGGSCPRHDPDNYEPSPYIVKPDPTSTAAADIIEAQSKALAEARDALERIRVLGESEDANEAEAIYEIACTALTPTPENPNG